MNELYGKGANRPPSTATVIRGWLMQDRPALLELIRLYLDSQFHAGAPMLASARNCELHFSYGLRAAMRRMPCMVAVDPDNVPVAYLHADELETEYELAFPTIVVHGLYVHPLARKEMIAVELLRELGAWMRERGFRRVMSPVQLQRRHWLEVLFTGDIWPTTVNVEWDVSDADSGLARTEAIRG